MDLGWQVIHLPHRVEWKAGDEFEAARKRERGEGSMRGAERLLLLTLSKSFMGGSRGF